MAPMKGIGFIAAIFISILAFDDAALQAQATLAILVASLLAGLIGVGSLLPVPPPPWLRRHPTPRGPVGWPLPTEMPSCRLGDEELPPAVALLAGGMIKA